MSETKTETIPGFTIDTERLENVLTCARNEVKRIEKFSHDRLLTLENNKGKMIEFASKFSNGSPTIELGNMYSTGFDSKDYHSDEALLLVHGTLTLNRVYKNSGLLVKKLKTIWKATFSFSANFAEYWITLEGEKTIVKFEIFVK